MRAIIIENEKIVLDGIKQMLAVFCPEVEVVGSASSYKEGHELLLNKDTDIVFLDIELGDGKGTDLLQEFTDHNFFVIFLTAFDEYAVQAFKFSAIDFLLKPLDPDDLKKAVNKVSNAIHQENSQRKIQVLLNNLQELSIQNRKIIVSEKDFIHAIALNDIYLFEAEGSYTNIHLQKDKMLASKNLKVYENILEEAGFFRVHHSYLVNLSKMVTIDKVNNTIVLDNGIKVPVSFRKKDILYRELKKISLI